MPYALVGAVAAMVPSVKGQTISIVITPLCILAAVAWNTHILPHKCDKAHSRMQEWDRKSDKFEEDVVGNSTLIKLH